MSGVACEKQQQPSHFMTPGSVLPSAPDIDGWGWKGGHLSSTHATMCQMSNGDSFPLNTTLELGHPHL